MLCIEALLEFFFCSSFNKLNPHYLVVNSSMFIAFSILYNEFFKNFDYLGILVLKNKV